MSDFLPYLLITTYFTDQLLTFLFYPNFVENRHSLGKRVYVNSVPCCYVNILNYKDL